MPNANPSAEPTAIIGDEPTLAPVPADPLAELRELRTRVYRLRVARDEAQRQWDEAHEAAMLGIAPLQGQLSVCKADCETIENELRNAAVLWYLDQPDFDEKQIVPGVGIQMRKHFTYKDTDAVLWAIEHRLPKLLKLDAVSFRREAELHELPFVAIESRATATIASTERLATISAAEEQME